MKIYNSLTRKKEEFNPVNPPNINMYTCGVTVYDDCHIGHARSLYIFEVMRRYLEYKGYKVNFVRNITDIDDKIIKRANGIEVEWKELVAKYISSYKEDLKLLNIRLGVLDKDGEEPRATKTIPDIIKYIQVLIDKGYAYEAAGDVYFVVRNFKEYGKLSGQSIDQMKEGVRIEPTEQKKDPLDFALWKKSKENEPFWDSPWGKGRPGWHIECSVMSQKFLKADTLDIHAGGRDLIFPHHENEVAQSEAYTGKQFANYWIHHGLLTINGQKMSKSLNNFITIKDVLKKCIPDMLKILYLQAHYSSPVDFSWDKINEIKKAYESITILLQKLRNKLGINDFTALKNIDSTAIQIFKQEFENAMDDDFNTPVALGSLFKATKECNKLLDNNDVNMDTLKAFAKFITDMSNLLNLSLQADTEDSSDDWIVSQISERLKLKKQKQYQQADEIRKDLLEKGIILEDAKDGTTTWRRKI